MREKPYTEVASRDSTATWLTVPGTDARFRIAENSLGKRLEVERSGTRDTAIERAVTELHCHPCAAISRALARNIGDSIKTLCPPSPSASPAR
jgi:alkylhydroperoxidase family enzyme